MGHRSLELGMAFHKGIARRQLAQAVEAQAGPTTVHQQLVAVQIVADDAGQHADGDVLQPAGADRHLLDIWERGGGESRSQKGTPHHHLPSRQLAKHFKKKKRQS